MLVKTAFACLLFFVVGLSGFLAGPCSTAWDGALAYSIQAVQVLVKTAFACLLFFVVGLSGFLAGPCSTAWDGALAYSIQAVQVPGFGCRPLTVSFESATNPIEIERRSHHVSSWYGLAGVLAISTVTVASVSGIVHEKRKTSFCWAVVFAGVGFLLVALFLTRLVT